MKTFKGTKGDWKVNRDNVIVTIGDCQYVPNKESIFGDEMKEFHANAKLIAAAPDLLEALQKATKIIESIHDLSSNEIEIMKECQKAINKAL